MSSRTLTVAFFSVLVAAIAGVLLELFPLVLPDSIAVRIARNSEGLVLALLLAGWVQFGRPRVSRMRRGSVAIVLAVLACLTVGALLLASDLPSRFRTLNETFLAAAFVIPYLQLRRPLPPRMAVSVSAVVLLIVVALNRTAAVTDLAEMLGVLLLAPLAFDVVDRGILDPDAATSPRLRRTWYALLIAAPICFSLIEYRIGVDGLLGEAVRYSVRITEAFVCLLLVESYFAVALRRTGRPVVVDRAPAAALR
jgi:hypothetical protein